MAIFKGGKGRDDTFTGTGTPDRFEFDVLDLTAGDRIIGGDGKAIDVLRFTTPGAISISALANVSGIERIELSDGPNSIVLTDALVSTARDARMQVVGGTGDDFVYAVEMWDGRAIDFVSNGGVDYVFAGEGDDTFTFAVGSLDGSDVVDGGKGRDTLILSGSGKVDRETIAGFRNLEAVRLGDGGVDFSLSDALMSATDPRTFEVTGGSGADRIDASLATYSIGSLSLSGGAGDDVIVGGRANAHLIDGGAGSDSISAVGASVFYDRVDRTVASVDGTLVIRGAAKIDLTNVADQSGKDRAVVTGFIHATAADSIEAVTLVGGAASVLVGGRGNDVISGGFIIEGGRGADTLIGSDDRPTIFILREGDFAAGETIRAHGWSEDRLEITGSADLRTGTVSGISQMLINSGSKARTLIHLSGEQFSGLSYILGDAELPGQSVIVEARLGRNDTIRSGLTAHGATVHVIGSDRSETFGSVTGSVVIDGAGGDDTVTADVSGSMGHSGGAGTDTLLLSGSTFAPVTIDLSRRDQSVTGTGDMTGFEKVDASKAVIYGVLSITGSASANTIIGHYAYEGDILSGGAGDDVLNGFGGFDQTDVLDGGAGDDLLHGSHDFESVRMIGGAGADTFRWAARGNDFDVDPMDRVTDFRPGQDTLQFDRDVFGIAGNAFDSRVVASGTKTDITGADLVIHQEVVDGIYGVIAFIEAAKGGSAAGLFVAARNSAGDTLLYHSVSGQYADEWSVSAVAILDGVKPTQLTLSDFAFI